MRVLQLTDSHVFGEPETRLKGIPTRESLQEVVHHLCRSGQHFDHVVVTGDHTHDESLAAYEAVRELLAPWLDRLHVVPGNHEDRVLLRQVLAPHLADTEHGVHFAFEGDGWRCVGLDSHSPGEVPGRLCAGEMEWLQQQVRTAEGGNIALFLHHPIVPVGSIWMDRIRLQDAEPLLNVLRENPAVRVVCCGHVHREFTLPIPPHAQMFTTPSTGLQFHPAGDRATFEVAPPGYRVFEFCPGEYRTWVERLPQVSFVPESE